MSYALAKEKAVPVAHLNGTSRESLEKGYRDMHEAISKAIKEFREASPHPRDYYVLGDDAYGPAREKHYARVSKLYAILAEIEEDHLYFHAVNPPKEKAYV